MCITKKGGLGTLPATFSLNQCFQPGKRLHYAYPIDRCPTKDYWEPHLTINPLALPDV